MEEKEHRYYAREASLLVCAPYSVKEDKYTWNDYKPKRNISDLLLDEGALKIIKLLLKNPLSITQLINLTNINGKEIRELLEELESHSLISAKNIPPTADRVISLSARIVYIENRE